MLPDPNLIVTTIKIRHIVTGGVRVSLRMRLSARIIRDDHTSEAFHALNEIVIDRGERQRITFFQLGTLI